jgi:hypothetical protein
MRPIRAELERDSIARAQGIMVSHSSPVLELCRRLVEAGIDPATPLEAYRGSTMCLRVRSIGEGAQLEVDPHLVGFIPRRERSADSPMSFDGASQPTLAAAPEQRVQQEVA